MSKKQSSLTTFFNKSRASTKENDKSLDISNVKQDAIEEATPKKRKDVSANIETEDPSRSRKRLKKKSAVEEDDLELEISPQKNKREIEEFSEKKIASPKKAATEETPMQEDKPDLKKEILDDDEIEEVEETPTQLKQGTSNSPRSKKATSSSTKQFTGKYDPIADAMWKKGEKVPYLALAKTFAAIEEVSGRLRITELLMNFFRSVISLSPDDLIACVYLSINKLAPDYVGLELGVGETIIMKAIAESTGRTSQAVKSSYDETGDLGLVAKASRTTQKTMFAVPPLTVQSVYKKLKEIASMQGNSSVAKKKDVIKSLLVACRECEAQYIVRSIQGKLRIGLAERTVVAALAHAIVLSNSNFKGTSIPSELDSKMQKANETLRNVYSELPNYDAIIPVLLSEGIESLPTRCFLTPGIPIRPMLAQPTKGLSEVLDRFSNSTFTCEWKYDGERAQIHYLEDGSVKIYSRNLENNTEKFPDVIKNLPKALKPGVKSFILDCEAVAFDRNTQKILPFQVLSTRARKTVKIEEIKVQVCLFGFDLLYLNGKPITKEPLIKRRELLHDSFVEVPGEFTFATYKDLTDTEEIQTFLNESVEGNCEGLMIKTLERDATYEADRRSWNWLKVKKDYLEGMGDSLDLVVIGGYIGRGKRTGVYGGYLLACYDDETETYQSVCKIGTGFSDENLQKYTDLLKNHVIPSPKSYYAFGDNVAADVWFEPVQVWEILAADLSISPVHRAAQGLVDPVKGIALRFPRFIRVREDKKPEEATTADQVATMYRRQKINHGHNKATNGEDDD